MVKWPSHRCPREAVQSSKEQGLCSNTQCIINPRNMKSCRTGRGQVALLCKPPGIPSTLNFTPVLKSVSALRSPQWHTDAVLEKFKSIFATQNNNLWEPWRLTWDKFPGKSPTKSFWTQPGFHGWLHKGEELVQNGLCHHIHLIRCSLCLWDTSLPCGPQSSSQTVCTPGAAAHWHRAVLQVQYRGEYNSKHFPKSVVQLGWQQLRFQTAWKSKIKGQKGNGHTFPSEGLSQVIPGLLLQSTFLYVKFFCFQFCGKNCSFYQQITNASKPQRNSPWGIWKSLNWSTDSMLGS